MANSSDTGPLTPGNPVLLREILPYAEDPAWRIYPVLDGAQFDDLPRDLAKVGIACRSLFKNVQDIELVKAGPWLVDPYHRPDPAANIWGGMPYSGDIAHAVETDTRAAPDAAKTSPVDAPAFHAEGGAADPAGQLEKVTAVVGGKPAAVFWVGDVELTEAILWRHLRGINVVKIPKTALPNDEQDHVVEEQVSVAFRHADANVMAQVLPNGSHHLAARIFGPTIRLLFAPEAYWWGAEVAIFELAENQKTFSNIVAVISLADIANIEKNRKAGLKRRAISEFSPCLPSEPTVSQARVIDAFERAHEFALQEMDDIWKFIELDIAYGYRFERSQKFCEAAKELRYFEMAASARLHYAEDACKKAFVGVGA